MVDVGVRFAVDNGVVAGGIGEAEGGCPWPVGGVHPAYEVRAPSMLQVRVSRWSCWYS